MPSSQANDLALCWLAIYVIILCDKLCSQIEVIVDIWPNQIHRLFSLSLSLTLSVSLSGVFTLL